jgi:Protein of unknown function (DUF3309)
VELRTTRVRDVRTQNKIIKEMRFILLLILLLLVIGALPTWPYSAGWGYYPSGLGLVLLIVLLIILLR